MMYALPNVVFAFVGEDRPCLSGWQVRKMPLQQPIG